LVQDAVLCAARIYRQHRRVRPAGRGSERNLLTTAVHLISAGFDVTVIRSGLGHANLDTTNHYAQASLEAKRKALEQVDSKLRPTKPPRWKRDGDLLAWLDSL
jgi:hypothetical protein